MSTHEAPGTTLRTLLDVRVGGGTHELTEADQVRPLADFECEHGHLPGDAGSECGCWLRAA